MQLPGIPLVVLDTETTGFVPKVHRVIEFASAHVKDGKVTEEYDQLFLHADVPPVVQVLTRIKTSDLSGKPAFADKLDEVLRHLPKDALLVGQNITFDLGMLKGEGIDLTDRPWIDTSMLASLVFPELESYSLGYLSKVLKLNHDPPHRALGDVRATLELLGRCWERLLELTEDLQDLSAAIMERAPAGYKMLFDALPLPTAKKEPTWLTAVSKKRANEKTSQQPIVLTPPSPSPAVVDEPLNPTHLQSVIEGALDAKKGRTFLAVKSLRPVLKRLPEKLVTKTRILYPPHALIDVDAVLRFSQQSAYTADEATLALKLAWYEPHRRDEFPCHGGEEAVWNGKLSSTATSKAYCEQFVDLPNVILLDHRELLEYTMDPPHPGKEAMKSDCHVIIDDASMLEDTATKAYGWFCAMDDVRAATQGNDLLTRFTDTLQLWVEKTRQYQDIRYLSPSDLQSPESKGLRSLLGEVVEKELPEQLLRHLWDLQKILEPGNLDHRLAWIEQRPNGSQMLQSVPERIGRLLGETLFSKFPTTLLIPQGSAKMLPEILPVGSGEKLVVSSDTTHYSLPTTHSLQVSFDSHPSLEELLTSPPAGKTVILMPGKKAIEDMYVKYAVALEAKGVTMICQGTSGGMGRMTAEFLAADAPALWLLTPWMFEGVDLPQGTVNRLILKTLPFDHPSQPTISRRSALYRDGFSDYSLPRLLHRLFRVLRTYARIKTPEGGVQLLDDRVMTKEYGKKVAAYLQQFSGTNAAPTAPVVKQKSEEPPKKKVKALKEKVVKKKSEDQPTLF